MTQQVINIGTTANDRKGDSLRAAFQKVNANFDELYAAPGGVASDLGNFVFTNNTINTSTNSSVIIGQTTTITDELTVNGDIVPGVNLSGTLGTPVKRWHSVYVGEGSLYLGDVRISVENGKLTSSVAFDLSGSPINGVNWNDISGKPTIPTDLSNLTDTQGLLNNNSARLIHNGSELVLTGGVNPYVTFPSIVGGDQIQIAGSEIASLNTSNLAITSRGNLNVISNAAGLRGGSSYWIFNSQGDLELPSKFPIQFTAVFDAAHYSGVGTFTGDGTASIGVELQGLGSQFQWLANDPQFDTNRGYVGQQSFIYTEADHGITGYNLDITMEMIGSGPYSLQLAFTPAPGPTDLAKIRSADELIVSAGNQGWIFGTDGSFYNNSGSFNINSAGTVRGYDFIFARNGIDKGVINYHDTDLGVVIGSNLAGFSKRWLFGDDGTLEHPGDIKQSSQDNTSCPPTVDTVIYTATGQWQHAIKLFVMVEGTPDGGAGSWETQACDIIAVKGYVDNIVHVTAYGVTYSSSNAFATFDGKWNATTNRMEITCRPTSLTSSVVASVHAIEMTSND